MLHVHKRWGVQGLQWTGVRNLVIMHSGFLRQQEDQRSEKNKLVCFVQRTRTLHQDMIARRSVKQKKGAWAGGNGEGSLSENVNETFVVTVGYT